MDRLGTLTQIIICGILLGLLIHSVNQEPKFLFNIKDKGYKITQQNFKYNTNPVFTPKGDCDTGYGFNGDTLTSFIIDGKEVIRFYDDSVIIFFKGKNIVIKEDSLCDVLNKITKETFNKQ